MEPKNNDARLKKSLFCKYDKTTHPSHTNDPVSVTIKMILKGFTYVSLVVDVLRKRERENPSFVKGLVSWTFVVVKK